MADFLEGLSQARATNWTTKGLTHEDEDEGWAGCDCEDSAEEERRAGGGRSESSSCCSYNTSLSGRECEPGREVDSLREAQWIVTHCSVLIGMHPDQAAEHLIDFALLNNKPFAVVPCCVYHRQFPHRSVCESSTSSYV